MLDKWNAHDLDGYLDCFWKSPLLVVISDAEVHFGWEDLAASYRRGFVDFAKMGTVTLTRAQIRMTTQDTAIAVTSWTVSFPARKVSGLDSNQLRKFPDGWKIILTHASTVEF